MKIVGLVLIVIGIVALAYQGLSYTTRETVLEIGPLKATADRQHWISLPPVVGGAAVVAGVVLLVLLVIAGLLVVRWLLAVRDVPRIWRRLHFLGDRLKVPRHQGDTPQEYGDRLATVVPPLDEEMRRLANLYTRASFRRDGLSADELAEARRAWRDALRRGRVVSEEEGAVSENPEPSRRR